MAHPRHIAKTMDKTQRQKTFQKIKHIEESVDDYGKKILVNMTKLMSVNLVRLLCYRGFRCLCLTGVFVI